MRKYAHDAQNSFSDAENVFILMQKLLKNYYSIIFSNFFSDAAHDAQNMRMICA
jgi:hypothetical protein